MTSFIRLDKIRWLPLILAMSSLLALPSLAQPALALRITDVELTQPFYLGRVTTVTFVLHNDLMIWTVNITAVIFDADWRPRGSTFIEPHIATLAPSESERMSIDVLVPENAILTAMRYRLGVNTTLGVWMGDWNENVLRDYWFDAYASLRASILNRLRNKTFQSPDANALIDQAVVYLNQAESQYFGTEQGYKLLLQTSQLIDKANLAEAEYLGAQRDTGSNLVFTVLIVIVVLMLLAFAKTRRAHRKASLQRSRRRREDRVAKRLRPL